MIFSISITIADFPAKIVFKVLSSAEFKQSVHANFQESFNYLRNKHELATIEYQFLARINTILLIIKYIFDLTCVAQSQNNVFLESFSSPSGDFYFHYFSNLQRIYH